MDLREQVLGEQMLRGQVLRKQLLQGQVLRGGATVAAVIPTVEHREAVAGT